MDEFSRIRANERRKGGNPPLSRVFAPLFVGLVLLAPSWTLASDHGGGHDAPAAPAAPAPPPPPPPPPKRPPAPPPKLNGPVAAPEPRTRMTWVGDPFTGITLGGFDPIAYFLVGEPRRGTREHEFEWNGGVWQFESEADLLAFRDAPEVYAPLFGGRCAFAVANGRPTEGSPLHFVVHRGRLLLFADAVSRAAFLSAPDQLFAEAERRWPALLVELP